MKNPIKDNIGKIIGWVEEDSKGNQVVSNVWGRIVSRYDATNNVTTNEYGMRMYQGNMTTTFLDK